MKFKALNLLIICSVFLLTSCSYFIDNFLEDSPTVVALDGKDLSIVFSHNVNGETHPCGCRHFPLGGLPQVAGAIAKIQKDHPVIYVDTGDTLFASTTVPKNLEQSKTFNAKELMKGLSDVGLKYWVPGDQDFSKGPDFIAEALKGTSVTILLSNLRKKKDAKKETKAFLPHQEYVVFKNGPHKIFVTGVIHPQVLPSKYRSFFDYPAKALIRVKKDLKEKEGYDENSAFHRLVILSHSGINFDETLAKEHADIEWIVGAHTMSFFRFPQVEGKTKIVQALSRNHYLGHITFNFGKDKTKDTYDIIEVRDELKDELKNNPHLSFIDRHKEALSKVQKEEQANMIDKRLGVIRYATSNTCLDCHQSQGKFWQKTSHSLAYQTLITAGEENNLTCVKCHSLGLNEERGFKRVQDILEFDKSVKYDANNLDPEVLRDRYWKELKESFGPIKSVRALKPESRAQHAMTWSKHDKKHQVNRNFANVQCLNCHDKHFNHPFDDYDPKPSHPQMVAKMKDKCLTCHDPDQSPEWYHKQENGLPGAVNQEALNKNFKKMSCPRQEESEE